MAEKQVFEKKDIRGSEFRSVNMSGAVFDGVDLSGARFFNINLRGARIGAVDYGGTSFSCMNTGEGHPRRPAHFKNIEFENCTMRSCWFTNTKLERCDIMGMTIDGVPVEEMMAAYKELKGITDELPALEGQRVAASDLVGKRFAFLSIEEGGPEEQHGVLVLKADGKIGKYRHPNESAWEIDEAGRVLIRSKDGRVSAVLNKIIVTNGKYELSGPFMLYGEFTHILREL